MIPDTLKHLAVPIDSLRPHPRNARVHDDEAIKESLRAHGQFRPIVVWQGQNVILAGNGTYTNMLELGAREIAATFVDVDEDEATRILLVDNRASELAGYDEGLLLDLIQSLPDLSGTGYSQQALDDLVASVNAAAHMPLEETGDPDSVPEPPVEPTTKRGDIIVLGRHRLMCGDSVNPDDVDALLDGVTPDMVWTDPPYGVNVVKREMVGAVFAESLAPKGKYAPIAGDDGTQTAIDAYNLCVALAPDANLIFWDGNYYASALSDSGCWLVWDKRGDSGIENTFADCELAWTNCTSPARIYRQLWNGMIREGEHEKRVHPTQKPVALAEWCYEQYGATGDKVLDLFGGSGTALIAAEKTGRAAYLMEMSEAYCDVIVRRYEIYSGKTATRLTSDERDTP